MEVSTESVLCRPHVDLSQAPYELLDINFSQINLDRRNRAFLPGQEEAMLEDIKVAGIQQPIIVWDSGPDAEPDHRRYDLLDGWKRCIIAVCVGRGRAIPARVVNISDKEKNEIIKWRDKQQLIVQTLEAELERNAQNRPAYDRVVMELAQVAPERPEVKALAARQAARYLEGSGSGEDINVLWLDFAQAIKNDSDAADELEGWATSGPDEDDLANAAGFGMVAGMMYASLTGIKLPLPAAPSN